MNVVHPPVPRFAGRFCLLIALLLPAARAATTIKESVAPLLTVHLLGDPPLDKFYPVTTSADPQVSPSGRVFVACGPTVVSNLMRYWEFPRKGAGSRTFTDQWNCTWTADFANNEILYDLVPEGVSGTSPAASIDATARLLYFAGTAMHNPWRTGSQVDLLAGMKQYLRFSPEAKFVSRENYTAAAWEQLVKSELSSGRPLIVVGVARYLADGGTEGHWFICDGYDQAGLFHIWWGSTTIDGQRDQWLPLDNFAPYKLANQILIGLQPDFQGKSLELTAPAANELIPAGTTRPITWTGSGLSQLLLEYSADEGHAWTSIATVSAAAGTYAWTVPAAAAGRCKLRVSDSADLNIYRKSAQPFEVFTGAKALGVATGLAGRLFQSGTTTQLAWTRNGVAAVRLEFSADRGATWTSIAARVPVGTNTFTWTVPATPTSTALVRISDADDRALSATSGEFSITPDNVPAAQLAATADAVALFHFEDSLTNASPLTASGTGNGTLGYADNDLGLGRALLIDNASGGSSVNVAASSALALTGSWTIQFWLKVRSTGSAYTAYPWVLNLPTSTSSAFNFSLNNNDSSFSASINSASGTATSLSHVGRFELGQWYHLALVADATASTLTFYIQDPTTTLFKRTLNVAAGALNLPASDRLLALGGGPGTSNIQFDGWIDELQILGRAVDPEISPTLTPVRPTLSASPLSQTVAADAPAQLSVSATGNPAPTYQWQCNGTTLAGATAATLSLASVQPAHTGLYTTLVTSGTTVTTAPAILGLSCTRKVTGAGEIVGEDIHHANGNIFDQVLLNGAAESITADFAQNQITRTSFVDLDHDIVQVEFSGPGTLSLVLDGSSGPAAPVNYNQAATYMQGHAGIVITGATENTNVSVFSVGRKTAVNQTLFKDSVTYDGIADLAFIAISSTNGKFGGVRTANANYFAAKGFTGLYAPGVEFTGPVYLGEVTAFDDATPVIRLGVAQADTRITGGDLLQDNGRAVQVSGLTRLQFTGGGDSHGNPLPAKPNRAVLQQDGRDVTAQIIVNPTP